MTEQVKEEQEQAAKEMSAEIIKQIRLMADEGLTIANTKGISREQLEAVYAVGLNYYNTGHTEEAKKIFGFLVLFDHLSAKYWMGMGATLQVMREFERAAKCYAMASFLDLNNPKPQYHAAECFLALKNKTDAESAIAMVETYADPKTERGREYLAKAAQLKSKVEKL